VWCKQRRNRGSALPAYSIPAATESDTDDDDDEVLVSYLNDSSSI